MKNLGELDSGTIHYRESLVFIPVVYGVKVGYVPQSDNVIFARLMDTGKLLYGRISAKEIRRKWLKMDMKVYLHE